MRSSVLACALAASIAACSRPNEDDGALSFGRISVGELQTAVIADFGTGLRARRRDLGGILRDVRVYRSGPAVLGVALDSNRVVGLVAFERLPPQRIAREFEGTSKGDAMPSKVSIARLRWLGSPLFSEALPETPPGWQVPTDFTVAASDKQFLVVRDGHAVSKTASRDGGWIVELR